MRRSGFTGPGQQEVWFSGAGTLSQVLDERMVADALAAEERKSAVERNGDVLVGLGYAMCLGSMFWLLLYAVTRYFMS